MRIEVDHGDQQWVAISLQLNPRDIDVLIDRLRTLRSDPSQHFHISTAPAGPDCFVDIEVAGQAKDAPSNGHATGAAIVPDDVDGH